ncbi:hypothetical protein B296_00042589 [Ensete ventricosum]|uniref:Uncharacterized protein n=1 Tax=Ensete ventricosum TaxID=4639 RepID=A0A426X956_ENSVE|nr:hypothetical protein B296_00042589 [Ensete ventricosum]
MLSACRGGWIWSGPHTGAVGHVLVTCKGWPAVAKPLARGCRPQGQQLARGGRPRARPAMTSPQGVATLGQPYRQQGQQRLARKGLPPSASPTASRGDSVGRRGGRPLAGRLSVAMGNRRLRRGSGGGGAVRVKEG